MNTRRFTIFAFLLAIVALIVGLSACDQIGQLFFFCNTPRWKHSVERFPSGARLSSDRGDMPLRMDYRCKRGFELALEDINNSGRLDDAKITFNH